MSVDGQESGRISRRRFLRGLLAGSGVTLLAACGAPNPAADAPTDAATTAPQSAATSAPAVASGTTNLVVMASSSDLPDSAISKFQAAYPDITIERIDADYTRLTASMTAGTPPDVFQTTATSVPYFVLQDQLIDLTQYFAASEKLKADDLGPSINLWKFNGSRSGDGALYGMHKDWSPELSLFINTAAFEEAGIPIPEPTKVFSYAELAELAPQLTKRAGDRVERIGGHVEHSWLEGYTIRRLLEENESLYAADYSRVNINDNPKVVEFLRYVYDLASQNVIWNPLNPSPTGWSGDDFVKGQMGMLQMGYWFTGAIRGATDSPIKDKVMMLPGATWTGTRVNPSLGGAGMVIAKKSANVDAAWKFFEYYMGDEPARDRAQSGWGVPALTSLYELLPQETAFDKQTYAVLQDELQYTGVQRDINPYVSQFFSWETHLEAALRGDISFEEAVANLDFDVNEILMENRTAAGV
jgi:multiple sugar transport system substrate-binding protein